MKALDQQIRNSRRNPLIALGGGILAVFVFVAMALTQLGLEFVPPEESPPLTEFHLPPPPPPPPAKVPPKKKAVSINFDVPVTAGAADVPIGFLDIDFGLSPKKLTDNSIDVNDTVASFETDGLEDLNVYDYNDVTEKPRVTYNPPLNIPPNLIGRSRKPVSFTYICRVNTDGRATNIHIIDTEYPDAIPVLVEYVKRIRFKVAKKDGRPVSCIVRRKTTFIPSSASSPFSI